MLDSNANTIFTCLPTDREGAGDDSIFVINHGNMWFPLRLAKRAVKAPLELELRRTEKRGRQNQDKARTRKDNYVSQKKKN